MKFVKAGMFALMLFLAAPVWATTIWGGFEDTTGSGSDYDYNDVVFSISGTNLTLNAANGVWFSPSGLTLGTSGTPFWNDKSFDGVNDNIGYCIYGGGLCNGGAGLAPTDDYLATATGGSVNDVYFSVNGGVTTQIVLDITADTDTLGWALVSDPSVVTAIVSGASFTPGGDFELVGIVNGGTDYVSDNGSGISQFAFFAQTPEPPAASLFGLGLLGGALFLRWKSRSAGPAGASFSKLRV